MRRLARSALILLVATPAPAQVRAPEETAAAESRCARWLPPAAVARAAGVAAVRLTPFEPRTGAGSDCNYAAAGDTVLLRLDVERQARAAERFARLRAGAHAQQGQQAVRGLGDEAFTYGAFGEYLVVRRGNTVMRLTGWAATDPLTVRPTPPLVSREQLIALARQVLAAP